MFLTTYQPTTPSLRHTAVLSMWYLSFHRHKRLTVGFQSAAGRGTMGQQTVMSKGSVKMRRVFRIINNKASGLFVTTMICEYQKDPLRSGMLALVYNSFGCWFYLPQTSNMVYLGYFRFYTPSRTANFYNWNWPTQLRYFNLHNRVCYIARNAVDSVQFLRSAGVSGLILSTTFYKNWSLILMPSNAIKIFPSSSYAHRGWICHEASTVVHRNKAGCYVNKGVKPRVRGTVKNSNDHPNGGRSRSLACSRTPWGYTAKKSRHPTARAVSKSLEKKSKHAAKSAG